MGLIYKNGILYTGGGGSGECNEYTLDGDIESGLTLSDGSATVQTLDINADTDWIAAELPTGASGHMYYRRLNGVVYVDIGVYGITITATATQLFVLPEGFRPVRTTYVTGVANNWNADPGVYVYPQGGVNARVKTGGTNANGVFCMLVYPAAS